MELQKLAAELTKVNTGISFVPVDKNNKLSGKVTDKQIEDWKKQCPDGIYGIVVKDRVAYFRYPNRDEVNDAISNHKSEKPFGSYELMANMTFIGGDVDILINDRLFMQAIQSIKAEIDGEAAEVINF